jgi:hypothetical protein
MTEIVRRRCMEPFFTTKPRGVSTGLGLAIVYGLLRESGGEASIESVLGKGTTFTLLLPAAQAPAADVPQTRRKAAVHLKDDRLRAFVAAELDHLSFDVTTGNGTSVPELVVADTLDGVRADADRTKLIFIGEPSQTLRAGSVLLGPRPKPKEMREALRAAAADALPIPDNVGPGTHRA